MPLPPWEYTFRSWAHTMLQEFSLSVVVSLLILKFTHSRYIFSAVNCVTQYHYFKCILHRATTLSGLVEASMLIWAGAYGLIASVRA